MPRRAAKTLTEIPGLATEIPSARETGAPFGPEIQLWQEGLTVLGIDEAGRGPLAGPVVAAAVAFQPEVRIEGIGDSKVLSAARREQLEPMIQDAALAWAVTEINARTIDRVNILEATRRAMKRAAESVCRQLGLEWPVLLVDGRIPPIEVGRHINVVGGDGLSFSIGAASILAKVHRDRLMRKMDRKWPEYGFAKHKGYPTREHRRVLFSLGPCPLHRRSFTLAHNGQRLPIGEITHRGGDHE